jgi:Spy/CpxP family protein refolding chaperone
MRKSHWKAVAVAAVLMMTVPTLLVQAADPTDKTPKTKVVVKKVESSMPGCTMHGDAAKAGAACKPGCTMHGEAAMPGCGMKGGTGKGACCKSGDMKGCSMKGGMGKGACCKSGDMKGCGMKGGKRMAVCVVSDREMKGCEATGGKGMADWVSESDGAQRRVVRVTLGGGPEDGPMFVPGMGPGMGAGHGPMMLKALDLTAEQQKKVTAIHEKQARLMVQAQADTRIAAMDLQQLMRAETPDKAKIEAQIDKLALMRAGMQKSRAATMLEVRALLTPEQLKKFQAGPMGDEEEDD